MKSITWHGCSAIGDLQQIDTGLRITDSVPDSKNDGLNGLIVEVVVAINLRSHRQCDGRW
jgi:hypothetical protein